MLRTLPQGNNQLEGAFEYLKNLGDSPVDIKALEESAGVGVVVSAVQAQLSGWVWW